MRRLLSILVTAIICFSFSPAWAESDFAFNTSGLELNRSKGRTLVGVTRDSSKTWSVYLARDKKAYFHFSSGRKQTATWRQRSRNIICFTGLVKDKPSQDICKYAPATGRGMDWKTVTIRQGDSGIVYTPVVDEHRGSSQIVYSVKGKKSVNQNSYQRNIRNWRGQVIVGRTLKDREAWIAKLHSAGRVTFVYGSGKIRKGRYLLKRDEICFNWDNGSGPAECRLPRLKNGKMRWISKATGGSISEIVYMRPLATKKAAPAKKPAKPVAKKAPAPKPEFIPQLVTIKGIGARSSVTSAYHAPSQTLVSGGFQTTQVRDVFASNGSKPLYVIDKGFALVHFLKDGTQWIGINSRGLHAYETETGALLNSTDSTQEGDFLRGITAIGFDPLDDAMLMTKRDGTLVRRDAQTFEILGTGASKIDRARAIAINTERKAMIAHSGGKLELVDTRSLQTLGRFGTGGMEVTDIKWSADNKSLFVLGRAGGVLKLTLRNNDVLFRSRAKLKGTQYVSMAQSQSEPELAVLSKERLDIVSPVTLAVMSSHKVGPVMGPFITYAGLAQPALIIGSYGAKSRLYAKDTAGQQYMTNHWSKVVTASNARILAVQEKRKALTQQRVADLISYAGLRAKTDEIFFAGDCAAYDAAKGSLRTEHQRNNCDAVTAKLAMAEVLLGNDCDAIRAIANKVDGGPERLATCVRTRAYFRSIRQHEQGQKSYQVALRAGDCDTVAAGLDAHGNTGDMASCQLTQARLSNSPRKLFFAAVKFEGAKDYARARAAYEALMEDHIEDDLALKAAERLTQLNDLALKQEAENQKIAALEAEKAANARAARVERQRIALEAERARQRQKKEREAAERKRKRDADRARAKQAEADRARKIEEDRRKRAAAQQQRKRDRVDAIKVALSSINDRYGFKSGYTTINTTVSGRVRSYQISGTMRIKPKRQYPVSASDYCNVEITSAAYPRYEKVNLPNNRYFTPDRGYNRFDVNLMSTGRDAPFSFGTKVFKLKGDKLDVTHFTKQNLFRINWAISIRKHDQTGSFYSSASRTSYIQVPGNRDGKAFFEAFKDLVSACQRAKRD